MQQLPTHPRLHVRDTRDALTLLEAVRIGVLPQITRRLNDAERTLHIRSGSIFIWQESEDDSGIKRWTDGVAWSPSRMREPFLFYEEKASSTDCKSPVMYTHASGGSAPGSPVTPSRNSLDIPTHPSLWPENTHDTGFSPPNTSLVKQAYSAFFTNPETRKTRKLHLTAYFSHADLPQLPTIDSDRVFYSITIPENVYRSGKRRTRARNLVQLAEPLLSPPDPVVLTTTTGETSSFERSLLLPKIIQTAFGGQGFHIISSQLPPSPLIHSHGVQDNIPDHSTTLTSRFDQNPRTSEDVRMIQMLNSRHIM